MSLLACLHRPLFRGVVLGLCCGLLAWLLSRTDLCRGLELWMLDGCFSWRGTRPTQTRVVLIALDEDSLRDLHKSYAYISPELAEVIRYADRQGATAIGVDLIVPADMSDLDDIDIPGAIGDAWKMMAAVNDTGKVVLSEHLGNGTWERPLRQWQGKALDSEQRALTDLAFVDLDEDGDQFVRRQQLLVKVDNAPTAQFALALYARSHGAAITWDEQGRPQVGGKTIPIDGDSGMLINYVGPPGSIPVLSFKDVLADSRAGRELPHLSGCVVLIGVTAHNMQDFHATPYANHYARWLNTQKPGLMSGTEVQANILATIGDDAYIHTPWWLGPLPTLLLVGAILGWAFARLDLRHGLLLAVGHHFAWKGLALAVFSLFAWRVHLTGMLLLGTVLFGATFVVRWRTLRRMFGLVKSEAIALSLESDPNRLEAAGEEREVTVMFADIRSFTDFSERHTPHQVVALLNAYFDAVVPLLEAEGGVVDKYMGDGIMALFGAPASLPDHPLRAARAAVAMVKRVHELRGDWAKLDNPTMRIGVGVHTGKVIVGAIGSRGRLDYTAIGDAVNVASRIESANKEQGTEVLLSAATVAAVGEKNAAKLGVEKEPRRVHVKGKSEELLLYPVLVG
jgi:adenylate cyclase